MDRPIYDWTESEEKRDKSLLLAKMPDVKSSNSFIEYMRHTFGYLHTGTNILYNNEYVIQFKLEQDLITVTHLISMRGDDMRGGALMELVRASNTLGIPLRVNEKGKNIDYIGFEVRDHFTYRNLTVGSYFDRQPTKLLHYLCLEADISHGQLTYTYPDSESVGFNYVLERDVDIKVDRNDARLIRLRARYLHLNREDDARRLLREKMDELVKDRLNEMKAEQRHLLDIMEEGDRHAL